MITDALLNFVPIGSPLSLVGGAGVSFPSPTTLDLLGTGVGTAPQNIIGTRTLFGQESGVGGKKVQLDIAVGTTFLTSNAATVNVQFQGAPDLGVGGSYQPGAWQTLVESGTLTAAQLVAGTVIARFDWPPEFPVTLNPRYLRLNFLIPSGTNFTAGTIAFALPTMVRDDQSNKYAAKNFTV